MKEKTIITMFCICLTIIFTATGALIHVLDSQARTISIQRAELDEKMDKEMFYHVMDKYMEAALHDYHIIASDIVNSRDKQVSTEDDETIELSPIQAELLMGGAESAVE